MLVHGPENLLLAKDNPPAVLFRLIRLLICVVLLLHCGQRSSLRAQVDAKTPSAETSESADPKPAEPVVQHFALPREHHAWGRFKPGAWRDLQVTTESFDEQGDGVTRNVTTQQEVLKSVTPDSYAFDVLATVDLAGKRIVGNWQTRVKHLATDGSGQILESLQLGPEDLTINGQVFACQQWELHYRKESESLVDRIHYSPEVFPFVLRRETMRPNDAAQQQLGLTEKTTIQALSIPYAFQGELISCSCVRTVRSGDKVRTVRIALVSDRIPGGEVVVWTIETDANNSKVRWSEQKLVGYGLTSQELELSPEPTLEPISEEPATEAPDESRPRRRRLLRPNRSRRQ